MGAEVITGQLSNAAGSGLMGPIGAGIEAGGSIIASLIGAHSAKDQMKFQERMSSTAHQREVKDMIAAGINPALSVMGGHGATSPVGTSFTPENPVRGIAGTILQSQLQQAQTRQINANASSALANARLMDAQTEKEKENKNNIIVDTDLKKYQINSAKAESEMYGKGGALIPLLTFIRQLLPIKNR